MGDMRDSFDDLKEASRDRKKYNQVNSTQILVDKGVEFEEKNFGVHLIVQGKKGLIDYWPSTGKFIPRTSGRTGRGVFNLLKQCEVSNDQ